MLLDKTLLDSLTEKAKVSPRLRVNFDLRDTPDDASQRMLNAIEPGTVIPGRIRGRFFDPFIN